MDTLMYAGRMKGRSFDNTNPKIKVLGIGAAGTNIIGSLFAKNLHAELVSINTDWTQLSAQRADKKLLIGLEETRGLGCGGDVIKGKNAAKESMHELRPLLSDTELLFVMGGLGNGTATGGLPEIAKEAKKKGALVVAFLIIPFFMKKSDIEKSKMALRDIEGSVDTAIVLDHNRLAEVYHDLPLTESFTVMNDLIADSINSIIQVIREREIMKVDFSHVKAALSAGGFGTIGISIAEKNHVDTLIDSALGNKLFYFDPKDARSAIVYITGDTTMSLADVTTAADRLKNFTHPDADVVIGTKVDESLSGKVRALVILTGMEPTKLFFNENVRNRLVR